MSACVCVSEFALRTSGLPLCVTHLPSSFNWIAKFVTQVVMSLSWIIDIGMSLTLLESVQ